MYTIHYSGHIVKKLEFSQQILDKSTKYQISCKSVQWKPSCSIRTDRQTW